MRAVPECLNRRYKALDDLIQELNSLSPRPSEVEHPLSQSESSNDPGIKLMCEFWNILKEDPDCNLTQQVKQRMGLTTTSSGSHPQRVLCYMAGKGHLGCKEEGEDKRREALNKLKNMCCQGSVSKDSSRKCCASESVSAKQSSSDSMPLSKVLCNLKEAASFDKKCNAKITDLMETQNELMNQIHHLEHREKEGIQLLKQADCMWSCMEDAYKKRVAESLERQKSLMKQLQDVEASNAKWRKNKKDLDFQMSNINKCQQEISTKITEKKNDIKCMDMEINDFQKRIESNKKETEIAKKSLTNKKQASDIKVASIAAEVTLLQKSVCEQSKCKYNKEHDGTKFVKEARGDLQKICRVLLQKKLENEDLKAEKDTCLEEICLLNQTMDLCKDRCKTKQETLNAETKQVDNEINTFKFKCLQCHQCTDTSDVRRYCTDCPRCLEERDCLYEDGHCNPDKTTDCVCMSVKEKFLDNVFENMYTVLERQSKTGPGKAIAEAILNCLKRSRNGKLNSETRKILQDFILNTVKKNLNLTIIGGAVKTRCELDPDTYKQLMLCLKQVTAVKPPKVDKGTVSKKDSCRRWGGTSECNCPNGPKACACTKRAPPPPKDPSPCPPTMDKEDDPGEVIACPRKDSTACGPDCALHAVPSAVGTDVAQWRPAPCSGPACPFSKSMRAAQCVLGPESLNSLPKTFMSPVPYVPIPVLEDMITCKCEKTPVKPCTCRGDNKQLKASCDMNTCATVWEQETNGINRQFSLIENEIRKESYLKYPALEQTINKDMPSVQADIFSKGQYMLDMDQSTGNNIIGNKSVTFAEKKMNTNKDQFKIVTGESDDVSSKSLTELTKTSSGTLAIALDEKVIELIDKKTSDNPNILVTLKKTDSGQFTVNFNAEDSSTEDAYKVLVSKTPSGTRTLEVHSNFVKKLQAKDAVEVDEKEILPTLKRDKEKIRKRETRPKEETSVNKNRSKLNKKANGNVILKYELLQKYDNENKIINLKIEGKNGLITEIKAPLAKTLSGNIAVDVQELALIGDTPSNVKERAVALLKSESGSYNLNINRDYKPPNAVIRKTPSGRVLVVLTDPVLKSMETENTLLKKDFFKLKIKNADCDVSDSPAVLKSTPSHNFIFIIDKEYEKEYENVVKKVEDNTECFINISRTSSDNYVINFDDSDRCFKSNAILAKTPSGNIKIFKDNVAQKIRCRQPSTGSGSKDLCEILKKLPLSIKLAPRRIHKLTKLSSTKSSSDSNLYGKSKTLTPSYEDILIKPLSALKKSSSGQYAVVMGKESKKALINNLKSYLQSNSQGLIPVRRSQSGEITIVLSDDQKDKTHYGSLKIAPSGNIFVLVDETLVKKAEKENHSVKNIATEQSTIDTRSTHMIGKLELPVNKAVATTCSAKSGESGCDTSKCICKELQWNAKNCTMSEKESGLRLFRPEICGIDWSKVKRNQDGSCKICDPDKCSEKCNSNLHKRKYIKSKDELPHIVIKPCACKPVLQKNPHAEEQCFYYVEAVCPFHKNRYDSVSNDLLEISGLCKKNSKTIKAKSKIFRKDNNNWDSLHYLPPQLPGFLSEFKYR